MKQRWQGFQRLIVIAFLGMTLAFATPLQAADPPPEAYDNTIFHWHAKTFFWVNRQIFWGLNGIGGWLIGESDQPTVANNSGVTAPSTAIERGIANIASNLINEPVTITTNLIVGDFSTAWVALQRFTLNSTLGLLGWYDVAADVGLPATVTDIGLILCSAGVGEGGYLVLPFIGPRTVRDGLADVVLTNAILWTVVGVTLGTGASWETIIIAETIEVAADIIATRQIDPHAKVTHFDDFNAVRKAYLEQRRSRCNALKNR